jgi:hypothetical protein
MKTILTLLFCFALTLSAELKGEPLVPLQPWNTSEARDDAFVALMNQAIQIEKEAKAWNDYCQNAEGQGCADFRDLISEHLARFITEATVYKTEGSDCRANLRKRTIAFEMHLFQYDLTYGGRTVTSEKDIAERTKANTDLEAEKGPLEKDMDACLNEQKPKL